MSITIMAQSPDSALSHPDHRYLVRELEFRRGAYRPKNDVIKFGERQIEVDHRELCAILDTILSAAASALGRANGTLQMATRLAYDDFNSYPNDNLAFRLDYADKEVAHLSIDDMSASVTVTDLRSVSTYLRHADQHSDSEEEVTAQQYSVEQHGYNVKIVRNDGSEVSLDTDGDGAPTLAFAKQVVTAANGFTAAANALQRIADLGSMSDDLDSARAIANAALAELTRGD